MNTKKKNGNDFNIEEYTYSHIGEVKSKEIRNVCMSLEIKRLEDK